MATHQNFFPTRIGDQIIWLRNYRNKIGGYTTTLGYVAGEIAATVADVDRIVYLLDTVRDAATQFDQAVSAYIRITLEGPANATIPALPTFTLSVSPTPPVAVSPAALKRVFAFIKNLKTRPAFTDAIGEDLGIIGEEHAERSLAILEAKAEARSGEVILTFKKMGHLGVWIEGQVAAETDWTYLAIDTSSPYNDNRPLAVPNQPEKRRYRLCYWDGDPTKIWSDILEVTFGG